jgi:GTP cyclohydrolase I
MSNDDAANSDLEQALADVLGALDLHVEDDRELNETPRRVSEMLETWLKPQQLPELSVLEEPSRRGDIVSVTNIDYHAFCAHHLVPFFGKVHVAYKVGMHLVGFGSIPRLVSAASKGPNLQERMGVRITDSLEQALDPTALLVAIEARQMCVELGETGASPYTRFITGRGEWATHPEREAARLFTFSMTG